MEDLFAQGLACCRPQLQETSGSSSSSKDPALSVSPFFSRSPAAAGGRAAAAAAAAAAAGMSMRGADLDETHRNLQAVLQYLFSLGLSAAAAALEEESGVSYIPHFFDIPECWLQQQQQQQQQAAAAGDDEVFLEHLLQGRPVLSAAMGALEQQALTLRSSSSNSSSSSSSSSTTALPARSPVRSSRAAAAQQGPDLEAFELLEPINGFHVLPPERQQQQQQQTRQQQQQHEITAAANEAVEVALAAAWGDLEERGRRCCCSRPLKLAGGSGDSSSSSSSSSSKSAAMPSAVYVQRHNIICCSFIDLPASSSDSDNNSNSSSSSSSSTEALLAIGSTDKAVRLLHLRCQPALCSNSSNGSSSSSDSSSDSSVSSCAVVCEWKALPSPVITVAVRSSSSDSSSSSSSSNSSSSSWQMPLLAAGGLDGSLSLLRGVYAVDDSGFLSLVFRHHFQGGVCSSFCFIPSSSSSSSSSNSSSNSSLVALALHDSPVIACFDTAQLRMHQQAFFIEDLGSFALQQQLRLHQQRQHQEEQQQQREQQPIMQSCGVSVLRLASDRQRGWLCASLSTGIVLVFSVHTQQKVPDVDWYATPCLVVSPDGGYLYVSTQGAEKAEIFVYALPSAAAAAKRAVAAAADGPLLQPAAAAAVLRGPQQQIKGLAFHPRLRLLAAVGLDKAVYLFT
ncbi:hypothetical protein Emag_005674 [Eimeria magna]